MLDDEEHDDCRDVVLHREYIVPILYIEEGPENPQDCVNDCETSIEGKLRDLSRLELAISISKFDGCLILLIWQCQRTDTIVSSPFDRIVDGLRIFEMDGRSDDWVLRCFRYICAK